MAILSKSRYGGGPSHGHDFDRIEDTIHGSHKWKINRYREVFTSDYVYVADPKGETDIDTERGVNKNRHLFHDSSYCNDLRDEPHEIRAVEDFLTEVTDDELELMMEDLDLNDGDDEDGF